jgi:HAD superfamily phosphoserine phosphatase-like hydrolase
LKELYYKRFRGVDPEAFNDLCERFVRDRLRISVKQSFLEYLASIDSDARVVVVSASIQNYLKPWCYDMGVELISTELEVVDGKLTGRFATPNCNGPEKARRITQRYDLSTFDEIHVFGNSKGDLPMLELGTHTYYQFFE